MRRDVGSHQSKPSIQPQAFAPKLLHPSFRMLSALISLPRRQSKNNEDDAKPPSLFGGRMFVSYLGRNHRYDSHRAGIHKKNLITDQDIFVAAILRGILHDRNRESIGPELLVAHTTPAPRWRCCVLAWPMFATTACCAMNGGAKRSAPVWVSGRPGICTE